MKIHDIILYEKEGTLSTGSAPADFDGSILGPGSQNSSQPSGSSGFLKGATAALGAVAAVKALRSKPSVAPVPTTTRVSPTSTAQRTANRLKNAKSSLSVRNATLVNQKAALQSATTEVARLEQVAKLNQTPQNIAQLNAAKKRVTAAKAAVTQSTREVTRLTNLIPRLESELAIAKKQLNVVQRVGFRHKASQAQLADIETKYMSSWGKLAKWMFRAFGLIVPTCQLLFELDSINADLKAAGNTPEAQQNANTLKKQAWGVFEVQFLVPIVSKLVLRTTYITKILKMLKTGAAFVSAPATAGASIAASVATDVLIDWAVWWLGTDEGRKFLTDNLKTVIETGGEFPIGLWDQLTDFYHAAKGQRTS